MTIGLHRVLFFALLLSLLTSCTLFPAGRDLPLVEFNCQQVLPRGYEVRATLRVSPIEHQYLLALGTTSKRIDFALLNAQGVPVYRLSCSDGDPQTSAQLYGSKELPPRVLLNYLAMIFMDSDALLEQLQPDWTLQVRRAERILARPGTALGVKISYQGTPPWFHAIDLRDSVNDITLRLVILESYRVLPE